MLLVTLYKTFVLNALGLSFTLDEGTQTFDLNNYHNVLTLANISRDIYDGNFPDFENKTTDISHNSVKAYLLTTKENTFNIVAFKGTTPPFDTIGRHDKRNDNLFFSCCFYKETNGFGCNNKSQTNVFERTCNSSCYEQITENTETYYNISVTIIEQLKNKVNFENTVFTGHSLGGAVAFLMGLRYNKPVVTFETPGLQHWVSLAKLKYNPNVLGNIYHYQHNADTIATGKCQGSLSFCYLVGYIIETKCHLGNVCMYDVINKLGIQESIFSHRIAYTIDNVITKWNNTLPKCEFQHNCTECNEWKYF